MAAVYIFLFFFCGCAAFFVNRNGTIISSDDQPILVYFDEITSVESGLLCVGGGGWHYPNGTQIQLSVRTSDFKAELETKIAQYVTGARSTLRYLPDVLGREPGQGLFTCRDIGSSERGAIPVGIYPRTGSVGNVELSTAYH